MTGTHFYARRDCPVVRRGILVRMGKYMEMFKVTLASQLAYLYDVLLRQIFLVVIMFIFAQLWRATFRLQEAGVIESFSFNQMLWYLAASESIVLSLPQVGRDIDEEVKSGAVAYSLNKPYSYPLFHYATYLANAVFRFVLNLLVAAAVTWLLAGAPAWAPRSAAAGLVSVVLAFTMDFWAQFSIAVLAFWVEDTWAFRFLYSRVLMVLGGVLLPLEVLPPIVRRVSGYLPVSQVVYGPAKTLLYFEVKSWLALISGQALWIAALMMLAYGLFRLGVKRLAVQGG